VVVKEIKTTALNPKQKAATMAEVEALAKLDHPNIIRYHDCFLDEVRALACGAWVEPRSVGRAGGVGCCSLL